MSSIVKAFGDLIGSVFEVIWSFIATAGQLVEKTFAFVLRFFQEFAALILNFFKGLVDLAGGLASFVLGKSSWQNPPAAGQVGQNKCSHMRNRKYRHPWCPRHWFLRLPPVPAQPGTDCQGWRHEAELEFDKRSPFPGTDGGTVRTGDDIEVS
jgi:hypothetical protein